MDLNTLVPAGGGTLSGPVTPRVSEPVATFSRPVVQHPDEIWSPRGSELAPPQRPLSQPATDFYHAESERPVPASYTGEDIAGHVVAGRQIRAALRPIGTPG